VNFDLGEVLTQAWQVSWKNKRLWWLGAVIGMLVIAIFPVAFVPMLFPVLAKNGRTDLLPVLLIGFIVFLILFFVILYFVSALTQTAITLGILQIEKKQEFSIRELLQNSVPFFWRVTGLMLLYAAIATVIMLIVQAIVFGLIIATLGVGAMCITPLTLLMYPFIFAAVVWMELAMNAIIIDGMSIKDSIRSGWQLLRKNPFAIGLVMIVVYFGVGMVSTIVVMPMMAPLFVAPFALLEGEPNWTIISISLLFSLVFVLPYALVTGWAMTFTKSAWVLTYLRLTHSPIAPQPVLQEVPAS
jgi:hypothetical protein